MNYNAAVAETPSVLLRLVGESWKVHLVWDSSLIPRILRLLSSCRVFCDAGNVAVNLRGRFAMYGKYFAQTFVGSMVGAGSPVFALWGYVIANARDGAVELNPDYLAMILGDPYESVIKAINYLTSPDPKSRTPAHEGRRLLHKSGFFYEVPNHTLYRSIVNEDERREYFKIKKREQRSRVKALTLDSPRQSKTVQDCPRMSTQSEAEHRVQNQNAEAVVPPTLPGSAVASRVKEGKNGNNIPTTNQSKRIASIFHRRLTTPWTTKEIRAYQAIGTLEASDLEALERYYGTLWPPRREVNNLRHDLVTFLNNITGEIDRAHAWKIKPRPPGREGYGA